MFSLYCVSLHCVLSGGQGVTVSGGSNAHNTCSCLCFDNNVVQLHNGGQATISYHVMDFHCKALFLVKIIKTRKAPARLYFQISRSQLRSSIWRGPVCPLKAWVTASLSRPSVHEWNCDEWEKILLENWKESQKQFRLQTAASVHIHHFPTTPIMSMKTAGMVNARGAHWRNHS